MVAEIKVKIVLNLNAKRHIHSPNQNAIAFRLLGMPSDERNMHRFATFGKLIAVGSRQRPRMQDPNAPVFASKA